MEENKKKKSIKAVSSVIGHDIHELTSVNKLHGRILNVTSFKSIETERAHLIKQKRYNVGIIIISTLLKKSGIPSLVDLGNDFLVR